MHDEYLYHKEDLIYYVFCTRQYSSLSSDCIKADGLQTQDKHPLFLNHKLNLEGCFELVLRPI